jgi:hypothetical protein
MHVEPTGFSERKVDYNHSLGTYRQACLRNLENLWPNFFDHAPLYMDVLPTATPFDTAACFSKLIAGVVEVSDKNQAALLTFRVERVHSFQDKVPHSG